MTRTSRARRGVVTGLAVAVAGSLVTTSFGGVVDMSTIGGGAAAPVAAIAATRMVDTSTTGGNRSVTPTGVTAHLIDDMSTIDAWTAAPADGVKLDLVNDDGALRMDYAFSGGGWAIARREVDLELTENWAITFLVGGQGQVQHLELKLIDETGENVYWHVRRDFTFPTTFTELRSKKRQVQFAWGPGGADNPLHHVKAIEIAVTAGSGGTGSVWIDDLRLESIPVSRGPVPEPAAEATSQVGSNGPDLALDGDANTWWQAGREERTTTLTLQFGRAQEFGGLTIDWVPGTCPREYLVELDEGDGLWRPALHVPGSDGGRDHLYLPDAEARRIRISALVPGALPPAISELEVQPLGWSQTKEAFVMNLAKEARRGLYPRGFLGEPSAWTVVGQDNDAREGLIGADGAIEAGPGAFTVEPFLRHRGGLVTWHDVGRSQSLVDGYLPIPEVTWRHGELALTVTAAGCGPAGASYVVAHYRLENRGAQPDTARLYLAVRPLQVNPPSQFLNIRGGTAKIRQLEREGRVVSVDGRPRVQLLDEPTGWGASSFFGGDIVADWLEQGREPQAQAVGCVMDAASGAAWWDFALAPGQSREVAVALPLHEAPAPSDLDAGKALKEAARAWHKTLDRAPLKKLKAPSGLSPERRAVAEEAILTAKAQVGWILVNRAGPAIQPGTRSYARSWIRDGALTGEALLRLGFTKEARAFLEWYAPHQYENGKAPCVVDARGADPVPEHDSTGQFIHLVAQVWRHTQDKRLLKEMWPRVLRGVDYLDSLLETRRTEEFRGTHFYGILPPSISHEGYSAKPMHSYWDDFFCLLGLRDAAWLAGQAGAPAAEAARLRALHDRFAADLQASIAAAMAHHGIDYVPGCADLGDFDATSTTIALDPCDAAALLPAGALERTFERYWEFFASRRDKGLLPDGTPWRDFTPYEVRCIGAAARLGWTDRAWQMTEWFLSQRAVPGWKVWGEVVHRDQSEARFIGDMPHGWVGSDFVRAVGDLVGK